MVQHQDGDRLKARLAAKGARTLLDAQPREDRLGLRGILDRRFWNGGATGEQGRKRREYQELSAI
jgi:hypothetical protein